MKNKILSVILSCITVVSLLFGANVSATGISAVTDGIDKFNIKSADCKNLSEWTTEYLPKNVAIGTEWYAMALSQNGNYDFSKYTVALEKYLTDNEVSAATSRQKFALTLAACNSDCEYIAEVMDTTIGKQGIMSYIFGLHLLNNGYKCNVISRQETIDKLISLQLADGGWAIFGNSADCDVTAMVLQSLAPNIDNTDVKKSIDDALAFLSAKQNADGSYSSYGTPNCESTAQVILALSSLNINPENDRRFVKDGNTVLGALLNFRLSDGTFCHTADGKYSAGATSQAYYCTVGYLRMLNGKNPFYIFDNCNPEKVNAEILKRKNNVASKPVVSNKNGGTENTVVSSDKTVMKNDNSASSDRTVSSKNTNVASKNVTSENSHGHSNFKVNSENIADNSETISSAVLKSGKKVKSVAKKNNSADNGGTESLAETTVLKNESKNTDNVSNNNTVKVIIIFAIILSATVVCAVLKIKKRLNYKNLIAVLFAGAILVFAVAFINISTASEYYETSTATDTENCVTLSIECAAIDGKTPRDNNVLLPETYTVLAPTMVPIKEDDTVYDVLITAAKQYKLQIDYSGGYVKGIGGIYEFDWGELSGWMYFVNGKSAEVGCNNYTVKNGDTVEWHYTCDIGNDLK